MLKRDVSRMNVLIASAGGMIGSGWLFSPYISAQMAGSGALISWILASVFMLFIALPLCELGTMFPVSGGMTNYPTFTHGQDVGFLFAWTSWLSYVVMTPIEIQAILQYASHFWPTLLTHKGDAFVLSGMGYMIAITIMLGVVVLNTFGIRFLAECNKFASIIKFLVPSVAIVAFMTIHPHFDNVEMHLNNANQWTAIFSALSAGGVAFAFTGFQNGLMIAGEVQDPQRNIPIAILGAVLVGFVLYFMLQWSFLVAVPSQFVQDNFSHLRFPGDSGPLVGLALLVGLGWVAILLMCDAMFSPFGTTLVYTAATSRILYGMALNQHLPKVFLKLNRYQIPQVTLYANFFVGALTFLPLPGWQKMVAFLSSCSILSYGIGPICLLAMRKLQPMHARPFRLQSANLVSHIAFYVCNLMLFWCGFDILWKLMLALGVGFIIHRVSKHMPWRIGAAMYWLVAYLGGLLLLSYLGTFGGIGLLSFPLDMVAILPFSIAMLVWSQCVIVEKKDVQDEVFDLLAENYSE